MKASFVELSRARRCLGVDSNATDNNNFFLRELDEDIAVSAISNSHQLRHRGLPDQLGCNVGGQDLLAHLCARLELCVASERLVAHLATDCTYLRFALRFSQTYIYLITITERLGVGAKHCDAYNFVYLERDPLYRDIRM